MLALLYQFERSQGLAPQQILGHQFEQLRALIDHARAQVPYYLVQLTRSHIEVRFVAPRDLTSAEEAIIRAGLLLTFRHPFEFSFVRVAEIARAPGAKFEEFISRLEGLR